MGVEAGTAAGVATGTTIQSSASGSTVAVDQTLPSHGMAPASGTTTAPTTTDWTSSLPEAQKQFVTAKGFKDPSTVLESYQNLEKLMGAKEKLIKLPDNFQAPEMNEVYDKLGRPKEASGYQFAGVDGKEVNPEFTKFAQDLFHKAGLSKTQGEMVANEWNKYAQGMSQKDVVAYEANLSVEKTALTKEWGAAYDQNIMACRAAMESFGLDAGAVTKLESALGYSATMKFLAQIGSKVGEDSFVTGQGSGFQGALTPDQAKATLNTKMQDPNWVQKALTKQQPEYTEYTKLHEYSYPTPKDNGMSF